MALGKISGVMLQTNLLRQGVDLQVDSDLVYFDVTHRRLGIGTTSPTQSLDTPGNARIANLSILGNTITSNTGKIGLGSISNVVITGGAANYVVITNGSGNLSFVDLNTLPEYSALNSNIVAANSAIQTINANIGAYQTYANANIGTLYLGNISTQANLGAYQTYANTQIQTINANLGAYELYANANIGTLYLGNISTQANLGAYQTYANTQIQTINANLGSFESYANATFVTATTETQLSANVGAYQTWANANIGTLYLGNISTQANLGAYQTWANANIGTLYLGNISTQANLGAYQTWANANAASQAQSINTINANLGAFETYANANFVTAATEYGNTQVVAYLPLYTGNLSPGNVTSTFYGNVHTDYIFPKTSDVVAFSGAKAITLPTGGNTARPSTPTIGAFRYNSDLSTLEFYNSSGWIPLSNSIESQDFYGDGINKTFTLTYATTAVGILVSINGTVQQPGLAYTVSGTQITFIEVPLTTDLIDIRYLASAVSVSINNEVIDSTPQNVNTVATIVDSWDSTLYCVAKYMVSGTIGSTGHSSEINLLQNAGQTAITAQAVLNIGSDTISYSANINGTTVNLLAIGTVAGNIRLQRTLFNI